MPRKEPKSRASDVGAKTDQPLIFPVGRYVGVFYTDVEPPVRHHEVQRAGQLDELSEDQFAVWACTHGNPEEVEKTRWTRAVVEKAARKMGVSAPGKIVDELLDRGLAAEVTPGTDNALPFARSYRPVPLMLGLGNTPQEPWLYQVGFLGRPVMQLTSGLYDLWEWSHLERSLWDASHSAARVSAEAGEKDPDLIEPERLLTGFLDALHGMTSMSVAYLDFAYTS